MVKILMSTQKIYELEESMRCLGPICFQKTGIPPPPPDPLTENQCEKRRIFSLAERGGTPPPLTENHKKNSKKMGQKGLKLAFLGQK